MGQSEQASLPVAHGGMEGRLPRAFPCDFCRGSTKTTHKQKQKSTCRAIVDCFRVLFISRSVVVLVVVVFRCPLIIAGSITLDSFQGVVFVGGFSYADVLDSAKGWAATIKFNAKVFERPK